MNFYILTIFPEIIMSGLPHSMISRGMDKGKINIECVNIRDFSADRRHLKTDDYPYGGGAGMLMTAQPVYDAYVSVQKRVPQGTKVIYLTPQGRVFDQKTAEALSLDADLILLCGRYEGIDERVIEEIVTDEISIGDYILTGGELPAMVIIDAVSRLVPGVLGSEISQTAESFTDGMLEYPQYTRPFEWRGRTVPDVLLSGHHEKINAWRSEQAAERTKKRRPELLGR